MPLFYKGVEVGSQRVDFMVQETVLVELKALYELTPTHHAQIINYLEAYRLEVGLLIKKEGSRPQNSIHPKNPEESVVQTVPIGW